MENVEQYTNGFIPNQSLRFYTGSGQVICNGVAPTHLQLIEFFFSGLSNESPFVHCNSHEQHMRAKNNKETNPGETLNILGILILIIRFKFHNCRDLWDTENKQRLIPTPRFSRFMSENRFDSIRPFGSASNRVLNLIQRTLSRVGN